MNPMMLVALLGSLGGMFFKDNNGALLRKELAKLTPEHLALLTNKLLPLLRGSPAFASAQRNIGAAGNAAQSSIASSLAQRGLSTSGIGAISQGAASSLTGNKLADLNSATFEQALTQAMGLMNARVGAAANMPAQRNIGADVYSGMLGALSMAAPAMMNRPGLPKNALSQAGNYDYFAELRPRGVR